MSVEVNSVDSISRNDSIEKKRFSCKFADPRSFVVVFTIVGNLEVALYFYLVTVLTTLESRFGFTRKTSILILICNHIAAAGVSPFIGFLGSRYSRPLLLGVGILLISISSVMFTIPYYIYGSVVHLSIWSTSANHTEFDICDKSVELTDNCSDDPFKRISVVIPVFLLCLANVIYGIGRSTYNVLGVPYLDDSVDKEKFPVYIGMSVAMRFVGPVIGYGLGSLCLLFHENPFHAAQILRTDPRFIGGWWLGFLLLAILLFLSSIALFFFPRRFKHCSRKFTFLNPPTIDCRAFGGFSSKTKRVLRNAPLLLKTFGGTMSILSLGYIVHSDKYFKSYFRKSQSEANFFSGVLNLFPMGFGMFFGGYLISKYKPKPKWLLLSMFIVGVLVSKAILVNMFLKCPQSAIQENLESLIVDNYYLTTSCNADCNCNQRIFQPICASDGSTEFFSACHAGCSRVERTHKPERFFECQCLGGGSAVSGLCAIDCWQTFYSFYFVCFVFGIINSVLTAGDTLVSIRCVLPEDKTFAFGFMQTFFSIFGWLPVPLIYDSIADFSCAVSSAKCGETNDCWIYDTNKYRFLLHGVTYFLALLAAVCNLGVLWNIRKLQNFYSDNKLQASNTAFGVQLKRLTRIEDETD